MRAPALALLLLCSAGCGGSAAAPAPGQEAPPDVSGAWVLAFGGSDQTFSGALTLSAGPVLVGSGDAHLDGQPSHAVKLTVAGEQSGSMVLLRVSVVGFDPFHVVAWATAQRLEGLVVGSGFQGEPFSGRRP